MSSRRLQDVFARLLKMFWKTKNCYDEDLLMASSRHTLKTSLRRHEDYQMFVWLIYNVQK